MSLSPAGVRARDLAAEPPAAEITCRAMLTFGAEERPFRVDQPAKGCLLLRTAAVDAHAALAIGQGVLAVLDLHRLMGLGRELSGLSAMIQR